MFSRFGDRLPLYLLGRLPASRPLSLDQPILLLPRLLDILLLLGLQNKKRVSVCDSNTHVTRLLLLYLKLFSKVNSDQNS